jgi:hypothetical protein
MAVSIFSLGAASAWAQPQGPEGHHKPPQEAIAACQALASGQACGFTGRRGEVKGNCWAPEGKPLACKPQGAPPPRAAASQPQKP